SEFLLGKRLGQAILGPLRSRRDGPCDRRVEAMRQRQEPEEAAQRAGEDGDRSRTQPGGLASKVVLDVSRSHVLDPWRTRSETVLEEQAGVPQTVAARMAREPASLAEEPLVLGQEWVMRTGWRRASRRVSCVEHPHQVVDCGPAVDEIA